MTITLMMELDCELKKGESIVESMLFNLSIKDLQQIKSCNLFKKEEEENAHRTTKY